MDAHHTAASTIDTLRARLGSSNATTFGSVCRIQINSIKRERKIKISHNVRHTNTLTQKHAATTHKQKQTNTPTQTHSIYTNKYINTQNHIQFDLGNRLIINLFVVFDCFVHYMLDVRLRGKVLLLKLKHNNNEKN